jgi:hypothetical protein
MKSRRISLKQKLLIILGGFAAALALFILALELGFRTTRVILTTPAGYGRFAAAATILVISGLGIFRALRRRN